MEMPGIAFSGNGVVQGEVGHHPPRHELLHHEAPDERQPLLGCQLVGQRNVDFTGKLRIPALFHLLDVVPEGFPVTEPLRGSLRQKDFLMNHSALGAIVKNLPLPTVLQTLGSPIGGYGHHRTASAVVIARNDLRFEVVDGQAGRNFVFVGLGPPVARAHLCREAMYKCTVTPSKLHQQKQCHWPVTPANQAAPAMSTQAWGLPLSTALFLLG